MANLRNRIQLVQGDITKLEVDAIVNAANESLLGGGGVDGAIHRAAGPELLEECKTLGGCQTGKAKITGGYNLPAKFVIHTVGPIWRSGENGEDELLSSCYHESLSLAQSNEILTIAFPCISTGVFSFPAKRACEIAVETVTDWLEKNEQPKLVAFCCFGSSDYDIYLSRLGRE